MMAAVGGLYTSWLAVQGTLRLQYAKTITLGVSIANELEKPAMSWLVPIAVPLIPPACAPNPNPNRTLTLTQTPTLTLILTLTLTLT